MRLGTGRCGHTVEHKVHERIGSSLAPRAFGAVGLVLPVEGVAAAIDGVEEHLTVHGIQSAAEMHVAKEILASNQMATSLGLDVFVKVLGGVSGRFPLVTGIPEFFCGAECGQCAEFPFATLHLVTVGSLGQAPAPMRPWISRRWRGETGPALRCACMRQ